MNIERRSELVVGALCLCVLVAFLRVASHSIQNAKDMQALNNGMGIQFVTNEIETIEYGDDVKAQDFVLTSKGTIKYPNVDTSKLGTQQLVYVASMGEATKSFVKTIEVIDSFKPKLKENHEIKTSYLIGEELNITEHDFTATDPVDGVLPISVNVQADTSHVGQGIVTVETEDKNHNKVTKTYSITVSAPTEKKDKDRQSTKLGDTVDAYNTDSYGNVVVRGLPVYQEWGTTDEQMNTIIRQINCVPQFLLQHVDEIRMIHDQNIRPLAITTLTEGTDVLGHFEEAEGVNTIYVNADAVLNDTVVIHECAHAYDADLHISKNKEFLKIYENEKDNLSDHRGQENIEEFFAYAYIGYLTGDETIIKSVPKTVAFFHKYTL